MQSSAWALLLRQVPLERQNNLMLVTSAGTEIAVQGILRIDHEFFAFKGRLAGSQDAGRLFFLPFNQIDYVGFQREIKEAEFHELFDSLRMPVPGPAPEPAPVAAAPVLEEAPEPEAEESVPETAETAQPVAPSAVGPGRTPMPIKSAVLERFRSRTGSLPGNGPRLPEE